MKYFPFVFTLFIFILALNMLGMIPGGFTVTSHIIVTFALAALVFVVVTAIGFQRHGVGYLKLFVPDGVPIWLMPLIVPIELISYLIRPVSLSVRLFANMLAGHTMLKVFAGFVASLGIVAGLAPFLVTIAFTGLEFFVAFIQAFIFTVLTCIYLNDAVNMHEH
jgi:F-type H+-transporting ATPase subunit a